MELQILLFFFFYCLSTAWFLDFSKAADQVDFSNEISALLSIKAGFIDPIGHLQDWKLSSNSTNHCNWNGVQCNSINGYVEKLHLSNMNLTGTISVEIQQLQNIAYFNICSNGFSSQLPKSLSNLTKLKIVDLSYNYFYGFPDGLGLIDGLVYFNASENSFSGYLPNDLGNATSLEVLDLSGNYFKGSIPVSYKNMMKLKFLGLTGNNLTGLIPSGLGEISSLETIMIGYNSFNGGIPVELGNLTNLKCLDIAYGNLGGSIPDELGKLQKLEIIFLFENNLVGKIPQSLGNLTALQQLDLSDNMLSEQIPVELTNLKNLWLLNLMSNELSGTIPSGISGLYRLEILALWNNNLTGTLPSDLGLNSPLQSLDISTNSITGLIPTCLCNQGNLTKIIMFNNQLTGPIPANLSVCASLVRVRMHNNLLSGTIPIGFGKLGQLQRLELANNSLSGQIPYDLSSSTTLNFIDFSQNQLQSSVPSSILTIPTLERFLVARNNLVGEIPDVFQDYPTLSELDLSSNSLCGVIPSTISSCEKLVTLNLRNNRFSGAIPTTLATMSALAVLDLSNNSLTGVIPVNFGNSPALETFNVSHNNLEGPVPENGLLRTINTDDLIGNAGLCGGILPPCSRNLVLQKNSRIKHAISGWLIATSTILVLIVACIQGRILYKKWYNNGSCFENRIEAPWRLIAFQRLEFRTKDILICLKESNILGTGANGVVYKAELDIHKTAVAVKKLRRSDSNDIVGEVNLLGGLRHRNIVRLLGFLHNDTDAMIICEYMPNGSLWEALHGKDVVVVPLMVMDWVSRYDIAMGVAQGLAYLHHDCYPPVIHRDIKSNNILLDENLEAKIADFGLAKMMVIKNETVSVVAGSYGYIAPEYGYTLKVDEKIDIYSYGVVLMELLTGKKPLDPEFGEAIDIVEWIRNNKQLESALDKNIGITKHVEEEMLLVLRIALLCTEKLPKDRPSMRDVITMLGEAKPRRKSVCNNGY